MADSTDIANEVVINGIYRDFERVDRLYRVIAIARDESLTTQRNVIYEQLYDSLFTKGTAWSMKLEKFLEYATKEGKRPKKFTLINSPNAQS